ncbi:CBN-UNC-58 protein [Caenorhabditis brenneri]|uniref:CBN-UNC-58 protein n=1 Tax=Caenorhabditis brenneri TaxID=135651 RepID=G0MHV8_CAEBE|nr:CBN-UNC-58 protein [Caenorhabditis brenneri]
MFFYSPNVASSSSTSHRRPTLTHQSHLHVGHLDTRLSVQIPEILSRSLAHDPERARLVPEQLRFLVDEHQELWTGSQPGILELCASPVSSVFSTVDARRASQRKLILRRPTISIQEDGKIIIDHVTARWEGANINSQSALLDADDGATVITDTIKDDQEDKEPKSCPQQTVKYIKILTPHVILVSVLIGYLCLGAWILMLLETRTELLARSKKLVRLTNLMSNFTSESWKMLSDAQHGSSAMDEGEWAATFREWMVRVSETVDDRRPIRRELNRPDDLSNMHNKWTFPTALLYVLTVLTTCGYGEVSVDTDVGKVFSVAFALVGIPLMFITAADIGKFLSETLLKFVSFWNRSVRKVKQWMSRVRHGRRKSLQSTGGQNDTLDILGVDGTEEKLWFPIGAYVSCICLYCSMGSAMFINWERTWSFIHAFHFGFNLIVTVGLGDIVVTDYIFLSLIVAFVIVGLSVVTMCVDLASTHLKAYFTRIHYFGRAKRFLGMSEELKEIVALLGAMRRKKGGKVTWNDVRDFLDNELRDRPFEPHELLMKLRFIDETSSGMSTIRHNSFQSDFFRESEYIRRVAALRPEQPAYL